MSLSEYRSMSKAKKSYKSNRAFISKEASDYKLFVFMSTPHQALMRQHPHPEDNRCRPKSPLSATDVTIFNNKVSADSNLQIAGNNLAANIDEVFLHALKYSIRKKQQLKQQVALKQIVRIFIEQSTKENNLNYRVITSCFTLFCLIVEIYKESKKENLKVLINEEFVSILVGLDVQELLEHGQHVESSLCHILKLCLTSKLFESVKSDKIFQAYKIFCLDFLQRIKSKTKVCYNTFEIIQYLQNTGRMLPSDYARSKLINIIKERTQFFPTTNPAIYQLSYRLLINADCIEDAFSLCQSLKSTECCQKTALLTALSQSKRKIPAEKFNELITEYLYEGQAKLQSFFYRLLRRQLIFMDAVPFLKLLESGMLELLAGRWKQVQTNNQVMDFVSVLVSIQQKARQLMLYDIVKDKILSLLPFIRNHISLQERQQPPDR